MRKLATIMALAVATAATPAWALSDGSFEAQGAGANYGSTSYCYFNPDSGAPAICGNAGNPWDGNAGLIQSGSGPWGSPVAQPGTGGYFSFVQGGGDLSQVFTASGNGNFALTWSDYGRTNNGGIQSYTVDITPFAPPSGPQGEFASLVYNPTPGVWTGKTASFFLTMGQQYTLTFQGLATDDRTAFIDAVGLAAVPEPAQWALMIGGFAFAGAALRRRRPMSVLA